MIVDEIKLQNYPNRVEKSAIANRIKFNNDTWIFAYIGAKYQLQHGEEKQIRLAIVYVEKAWTVFLVITVGVLTV